MTFTDYNLHCSYHYHESEDRLDLSDMHANQSIVTAFEIRCVFLRCPGAHRRSCTTVNYKLTFFALNFGQLFFLQLLLSKISNSRKILFLVFELLGKLPCISHC